MGAIEENRGIDFDRFLLFHPQAEMTYIRQLSMSYGYYTALDSIDESVDGVSWLSGKTAGTFFQKNIKGVNDYFWFRNSKKKELRKYGIL